MAWYLAKGLVQLRKEINTAYPKRDKTSDGSIGDASHQARKSDHNPDYSRGGVVRAIDTDKDGIEVNLFVEFLVGLIKQAKPRCDGGCYVIFNGVIWTATNKGRAAKYTGTNPHQHHVHFSICDHHAHYDSTGTWGFAAWLKKRKAVKPSTKPAPKPVSHPAYPGTPLKLGVRGSAVRTWQDRMHRRGWNITVDGDFGSESAKIAKEFRAEKGLSPFVGEVDRRTWDAAWTSPVK
jgi:hypothetical protein